MAQGSDKTRSQTRKDLLVIYMVDASGSMIGSEINIVSAALDDAGKDLYERQGTDAEARIAVMTFGDGVQWMHGGPVPAKDFKCAPIEAEGLTPMGAAFMELNDKLSTGGFLKPRDQSFAPVIFLITDGIPSDDYKAGLAALRVNEWFQRALKIAVMIGDDTDAYILAEFTGDPEKVMRPDGSHIFSRMVKAVDKGDEDKDDEDDKP